MPSSFHTYPINKPFMFAALFCAVLIHSTMIPLFNLIKNEKIEKIEPKLVLELINNIQIPEPIKPIVRPEINNNIQLTKPEPIDPLNKPNVNGEIIKNNIDVNNEIIKIEKPKPIQNVKKIEKLDNIVKNIKDVPVIIQIPKPNEDNITNEIIKTNQPNILPNIVKTEANIIKLKPSEKLTKPDKIVQKQEPMIVNNNLKDINNQIDINLNSIPKKQINEISKVKKPILNNTSQNELTTEELDKLEQYKNNIRSTIQSFAIANYPNKLKRRRIQGIVQLIFQLNTDGSILNVKHGPNTNAPQELVDAAIKALNDSAPFKSNDILKENNEFSIDIVYKIQ